jgi:hypothetical protein
MISPEVECLGMSKYSKGYNTGFVYVNGEKAIYVINEILQTAIQQKKNLLDETVVRKISPEVKKMITLIDSRYNVGRTGFERRMSKATKPIIFIHAHLEKSHVFQKFVDMNIIPKTTFDLFKKWIHK